MQAFDKSIRSIGLCESAVVGQFELTHYRIRISIVRGVHFL